MTNKTKAKFHQLYGDDFLTKKYSDCDTQQLVKEEKEFMLDTLTNLMFSKQIENYYKLKGKFYIEDLEFDRFIDYWHYKNQPNLKGYFYFDSERKVIEFFNNNKKLINIITF